MAKKQTINVAVEKTHSGTRLIFEDSNGESLKVYNSSALYTQNEDGTCDSPQGFLWLGIDAKPMLLKKDAIRLGIPVDNPEDQTGWVPYPLPKEVVLYDKAHLDAPKVSFLLAVLRSWLNTGDPYSGLSQELPKTTKVTTVNL